MGTETIRNFSLYGLRALGWTVEQAAQFRATTWRVEHPVWDEFIRRMTARLTGDQQARGASHA